MRYLAIILLLCLVNNLHAQSKWTIYDTLNSPLPNNQVHAVIVDQENVKWIGTIDGLARLEGTQWTVYNMANSPLPSNGIYSLAVDKNNNLFIGTDKGLVSFDGLKWTNYNAPNSPSPEHIVNKMVYDEKRNILWISNEKALIRYDGFSFTWYDANNSLLFDTFIINSLAVDQQGKLWIGAFDTFQFNGRLLSFDGNDDWNMTRLEAHELTSTFPYALVVDAQNKLWMGTGGTTGGVLVSIHNNQWQVFDESTSKFIRGANAMLSHNGHLYLAGNGLTVFNGKEWTGFDKRNSPLPDNYTYALAADQQGNIWTGTIGGGIAVYGTKAAEPVVKELSLRNYPNPFSQSTKIQYDLPASGNVQVCIYNGFGQLIKVLENENKAAGRYQLEWNTERLAVGIYYCLLQLNQSTSVRKLIVHR